MKPVIKDNGNNVIPTALCANCGHKLPFKEYTNERGVACCDTSVIVWNFCPICGEKIEGYEERGGK